MSTAPSEASETDAQLLARLRSRDPSAFEALVRRNGPRLLSVARRLLRNEEDARDAVQEAFISAFKALDAFEGGAALSTWLHRIALNAALQRLRTMRRRPEDPIDALLPRFRASGHHAEAPSLWKGADRLLEERETRDFVRAAIDKLPESYRTVLLLRDIEELDGAEVARALDITENLVKVRLHRARQALRTLLEPRFRSGGNG